jgi:hypothetical protein
MWASPQPTVTAGESAAACARGIQKQDLRKRVTVARSDFLANSARLQEAAAGDKLHEAADSDYPIQGLSRDELLWLYKSQLARRHSPGRAIYDQIMVGAPFGLCVYCRHSAATTLDHFVPKTLVPGLSIDPWNLVPACPDCNHGLLASFSPQPAGQMLHPYFIPPIGRWLTATVDHALPVVVLFAATPDTTLAPELQARIRNQFSKLELGRRYSVLCGSELSGLSRLLPSQFRRTDPAEISAYLSETSRAAFMTDPNDRRAVMYEALAADDWYCTGGYAPAAAA